MGDHSVEFVTGGFNTLLANGFIGRTYLVTEEDYDTLDTALISDTDDILADDEDINQLVTVNSGDLYYEEAGVELEHAVTVEWTDGEGATQQTVLGWLVPEDFPEHGMVLLLEGPLPPAGTLVEIVAEDFSPSIAYGDIETMSDLLCFAEGTLICTMRGEVAIEALMVGDLVETRDNGFQPLRWIGSTRRPAVGAFAPVLIRKGTLGNDRDLRVSPNHRMLVTGWRAEVLFGAPEVLVTAASLVNDSTILRDTGGEVTYHHLLFDRHEIIFGNGAPSESFRPGETALAGMDAAVRDEVLALFPELADGAAAELARPVLPRAEERLAAGFLSGM
ncbi:Hint domain-containing protein [Algicella marina]|uniref:Hemolysin n=1 Tax=Algicella marina TaxID=2683284 RepID=A0A6P1T8R0_9RHOB|nr:Hint domain-containing protein [Algicella marina]QHQ37002.1 hemolysin [Algicella marina]